MLLGFAIRYGLEKQSELHTLIIFAVLAGVLPFVILFLIRMTFIAPAQMILEVEEKSEAAKAKLDELQAVKPLEIEALPAKKLSDHSNLQYAAEILVNNENQGVSGVKLRLLKVEPPFQGLDCSSKLCDLDYIKFSLDGTPGSVLGGKSDCRIPIFKVERARSGITLNFCGEWVSKLPNVFSPRWENQKLVEHIITLETSASGVDAHRTKFKMSFSMDDQQLPVILEKINPPQKGPNRQGKTKKHRDPAAVIILMCFCAVFTAIIVVQHLQISKLKNPPTPKSIAKKTLPDTIIPKPETPKSEPAPQPASVELQKQFDVYPNAESNSNSDADVLSERIKAETKAQKTRDEAEERRGNLVWQTSLKYFNHSLTRLHDLLHDRAASHGDSLAQSFEYPSLPSTIRFDMGLTNIAEIKLQKNTNWDFIVAVIPDRDLTRLRISCSGGLVEMRPNGDASEFHLFINFPTSKLQAINYKNEDVPIERAADLIDTNLNLLMAGQYEFLSNTNLKNK